MLPNRLEALRTKLEQGETITQEDTQQANQLMELDTAIHSREMTDEAVRRVQEADHQDLGVPLP